jgi:hypothetical protein
VCDRGWYRGRAGELSHSTRRVIVMLFADTTEDIRGVGGVVASILGLLAGIYFYWKSTNNKPDKRQK